MRLPVAFGRLVVTLAFALLGVTAAFALPRSEQPVLPVVDVTYLPREVRQTLVLIRASGPFPYERDGVRFGNRERLLPPKSREYYREYTVPTPGALDRGAQRIVCGGPATAPYVCYYTADHYRSFKRIRE